MALGFHMWNPLGGVCKGGMNMKNGVHKKLEETLIPNTVMEIILIDGIETAYVITPEKGYKLHAKELDHPIFDEESMTETNEIELGFTEGIKSCSINYNFAENPREFYAVESDEQ